MKAREIAKIRRAIALASSMKADFGEFSARLREVEKNGKEADQRYMVGLASRVIDDFLLANKKMAEALQLAVTFSETDLAEKAKRYDEILTIVERK